MLLLSVKSVNFSTFALLASNWKLLKCISLPLFTTDIVLVLLLFIFCSNSFSFLCISFVCCLSNIEDIFFISSCIFSLFISLFPLDFNISCLAIWSNTPLGIAAGSKNELLSEWFNFKKFVAIFVFRNICDSSLFIWEPPLIIVESPYKASYLFTALRSFILVNALLINIESCAIVYIGEYILKNPTEPTSNELNSFSICIIFELNWAIGILFPL